jgi:hypothetical protein
MATASYVTSGTVVIGFHEISDEISLPSTKPRDKSLFFFREPAMISSSPFFGNTLSFRVMPHCLYPIAIS